MQPIFGTETEFGILARDPQFSDPVSNSLQLIGFYPHLPVPKGIWDYENENPLLDARGFEVEGERERPGPDYNRLLNKLVGNGGRWYVDGAHPEYSTPECSSPRELVAYERAGERIAAACVAACNQSLGADIFSLYKNNSDGKGNSYGYHENYLISREVPFDALIRTMTPFFVTRQIFCGAGKVGSENSSPHTDYQISQRADFFECLVDLNTMVKRPIINTRDEPHADNHRYRRFHVIVGDANMTEVSTYLKIGTTAIVMHMLEEKGSLPVVDLEEPVKAIKAVSRDLAIKEDLRLTGGRVTNAIAIQRQYLQAAYDHFSCHECSPEIKDVLVRWEMVLNQLERDPMQLEGEVDWVTKRHMIQSYMERKGYGWKDPRVSMLDLQYHDIRPEKGLFYTLERNHRVERIVQDEEIARAEHQAPMETRAYFRGECLKRFPNSVYGMSWTSVLFDVGNAKVKRIPLLDPRRGNQVLTRELFEGIETVDQLMAKLGS